MNIEAVSASFWFIFLAYIAAFLPWTALNARDFIGPKWKTVRDTRIAGQYNVLFSVIPACYILAYIVVQGLSSEYTEMCAALVALVFSILHLLRSLWGLWQLRYFYRWAMKSIDALEAIGVPYRLTSDSGKAITASANIADHLLVNDSIIDNQLMNGEVRCYLKYADLTLHGGPDSDSPVSNYLRSFGQGARIVVSWLLDQARPLFGLRTSHTIEQVPIQPVNVWLNWSVAFAAQGLGSWIKEFSVLEDPKTHPDYNELTARERLDKRAQYFASELLSSAWLQLWPELGLSDNDGASRSRKLTSPFHWDRWDKESSMANGVLLKEELLERVVMSGDGLPFGAAHDVVKAANVQQLGYGAYRRALGQVVNEVPVRVEFDAEIEGFDIERMEWLEILLYLGTVAIRMQAALVPSGGDSSRSLSCDPSESSSSSGSAGDVGSSAGDSESSLNDAASSTTMNTATALERLENAADEMNSQAVENLRTQLNLPKSSSTKSRGREFEDVSPLLQCASITVDIKRLSRAFDSDKNRHVLKVGEMIDAWMALAAGDQVSFMGDSNGSSFWEDVCSLGGKSSPEQEGAAEYAPETCRARQTIHAEVEKRRLYYNFANKTHCYDHLDQFVTFMGYQMETVRSRLGSWVRAQEGLVRKDSFRPVVENLRPVTVELGDELSQVLLEGDTHSSLTVRGVQVRLLWELQLGLAREENEGPECISNIALCILSFPSLCIDPVNRGAITASCETEQGQGYVFVRFCGCVGESRSPACDDDDHEKRDLPDVKICAMAGPQRCLVIGKLSKMGRTLSVTMSVHLEEERWRFEWVWWRDAFLGRLMGQKEWQEERNIPSAELHVTVGEMELELGEVCAPTGERFLRWEGWKPFRFGFIRFELESEGVLKERVTSERVEPMHFDRHVPGFGGVNRQPGHEVGLAADSVTLSNSLGAFYQVQTTSVEYTEASPVVLRHACLLVEEAFSVDDSDVRSSSEGDGVPSLMEMARKCLKERKDSERASLLFEIAATIHGHGMALERCVDLLMEDTRLGTGAMRAVNVIEKFVAKLFTDSKQREFRLRPAELDKLKDYVLPSCQKVVERFGDQQQIIGGLSKLFAAVWVSEPKRFTAEALSSLQVMFHMSKDGAILQRNAFLLSRTEVSESFNAKIRADLTIARNCGASASDGVASGLGRDTLQFCKVVHRNTLREAKSPGRRGTAAMELAELLERSGDGAEADSREAVSLYRFAIDEAREPTAMNNLAYLLETGVHGLEKNPREAVDLYRRAIDLGHSTAPYNLGLLLENGADGVEANPVEAAVLYQRSIDEGGNMVAMNYLGLLLENGADGVEANPREAAMLYRCAIVEGRSVDAMNYLGLLLENGADGVEANPREAATLYRRAIVESRSVDAMYNLGDLLHEGCDGVEANPREAAALYRRAIDEGDHMIAMNNLGALLTSGAEGVERDAKEAEALFRRAIETEPHARTMFRLGALLESGAEGVRADPGEAVVLYRQAIDQGNEVDAIYNLGRLLERGAEGIERDVCEAMSLYERAVEEGNDARSMYRLGVLLETGAEGVDADVERAAMLYEQAGEQEDARERLSALRERMGGSD